MLKPVRDKYETTAPLVYKEATVPQGYRTDGITYKLRVLGLFYDKFDPRYIKAVLFHDYLVQQRNWELANQYFEELLPGDFRSKVMVLAVKVYRKWVEM
jgi:hypothetical protein